ncbi:hypothetical protein CSKR_105180 [Clonorchis sinensis]|uniref:Uncharacterized protein n=2 Tax=Clonorchis sinensis TaxID=79923 RepID=G7YMW0_CLOSI|nr:hypothetical protein CSKR_105180 [Clonorchis sinensis]GAA54291.1 hypothetical protein CLF_113571 [Clonorchis sinensis]
MRLRVTVIVLLCLAEMYGMDKTPGTLVETMKDETCERLQRRTETICSLKTLGILPDYRSNELKFPLGHDLFRIAV